MYLYRHKYKPLFYADGSGCLIAYQTDGFTEGSVPYCKEEDLPYYFKLQERYFNEVLKIPHIMVSADNMGVEELKKQGCLDDYDIVEVEYLKDYLYNADALKELKGKRYNKKRNLINQFLKNYENRWEYCGLSCENKDEIVSFLREWYGEHSKDEELQSELIGINDIFSKQVFFDNFKFGGIRIDGRLKAFSFGAFNEKTKTAVIDVEKADKSITGLYQLINREFLVNEFPDALIVNREDDADEENLRKAKLSYFPADFERKYTVCQRTVSK